MTMPFTVFIWISVWFTTILTRASLPTRLSKIGGFLGLLWLALVPLTWHILFPLDQWKLRRKNIINWLNLSLYFKACGLYTTEEIHVDKNGRISESGPIDYKIPTVRNIPREFKVKVLKGTENNLAVYSAKVRLSPLP